MDMNIQLHTNYNKLKVENKELKKRIKELTNFTTKEKVKERDNYKCRLCGNNGSDGMDLNVHHLTPRSSGGNHTAHNLITVCESCHHFLHANPQIIIKQRLNIKRSALESTRKGRPKGVKDSKPRRTEGYHLRYKERQKK